MTTVCVLGATGLVGRAMLRCLEERAFPVTRLVALGSGADPDRTVPFAGERHPVHAARAAAFEGVELVLASAGADVSRELLPAASAAGCTCIDNSSAFRLDVGVPLVVPEVNGHLLDGRPALVANPNCSTIQLVCALAPLQAVFGLESVRVATYQSASGAGREALLALEGSADALDAVPAIGALDDEGRTEEERKLVRETRKILDEELAIDAMCVRVPTRVGHGEAVWVTTQEPVDTSRALAAWEAAPGIRLDGREGFSTPRAVAGTDPVHVGRVRRVGERGLCFWVVADNLRKGAALNAVQIAERLYSASRNG